MAFRIGPTGIERATIAVCDTGLNSRVCRYWGWRTSRLGGYVAVITSVLAATVPTASASGWPLGISVPSVRQTYGTPTDSIPASVTQSGTVFGIIRSRATGEILPGASVEMADARVSSAADSDGNYLLRDVPSGTNELHVVASGYEPLAITVSVPPGETVRIDIILTLRTIALPPVHIVTHTPGTTALTRTMTTDALGSWHWHGDAASATTVMGEPDLFRMLSGNPNVTVRPDGPPILMDRGSGVDEMLVLLDGFPIWSPVHSGGVLSVISPDAVDGLILHDDAMPAQYGGRLASVLDFHPRVADNDSVNGSITFGSVASRVMAQRPVHFGSASGDALLAIRRSNVDFFPYRSTSQSILDRWGDGVGMFSLAHGATTLRFLALASSDRLGQIPWGTRTIGVNWMQQVAPTAHLETRIWKADFHTNMSQGTDSAALALDNGAHQLGMSSQLNWGSSTFGTSLEMMDVRYNVNATATTSTDSSSGLRPTLNLRAAPILATAFADRHWGLATGLWEAQTGFRATGLLGGKVFLEPRVSAAVRLNSAITATAGYARTHQFVQSLRNPNAQLSTLIGIDLPVAAGSGGVPIAQSDAVTAALSAHVSPYLQLALTSYVRRLSGLALPDSSNTALFAERGFENAVGRAAGAGAALAGQAGNGRFAWQVTYGISHVRYSGAGITAVQTPTLSQTSTASLTFQFDRLTQLRVVGWEGTGPQATWFAQVPTVGIPDRTEVESETGGGGDPSRGSGQTLFQTGVEQRNLPQYLRFDLNATHEWSVGSPHGKLAVFLTLANVFNHANVATYDSAASGGTRTITLVPRSLLAGITWRY